MTENNIKKLQEYRNTIFLSEIGALIHDLGKLNDSFVEKQSIEGEKEPKLNNYHHGDILEYDSNEHNNFYPGDEVLRQKAEKLKNLLTNTTIKYDDKRSNLHSFIKYHHCKDEEKGKECPDDFVRLLKASDSRDAAEDRNKASDKQKISKTYYSTAFGYEEEMEGDYKAERNVLYDYILDILDTCDINAIKTKRRAFFDILKKSFSKALGMTARAANDVSLWEHSYMTASIMKALLCQSILENKFLDVKDKEGIENVNPFKIYSVGWDFFEFVSQSHKIPDVVGRIKVLDVIKEELKNLVEAEFLLGNCIYEDDYGLHFLVPAAFDEERVIEDRVFEIFNVRTNGVLIPHLNLTGEGGKLTELLPDAPGAPGAIGALESEIRSKSIKDFVPNWTSEWKDGMPRKKLICRVCGKGFYCEGKEEICETCKGIRNKGRERQSQETICPETIFIEELAWNGKEYENVALVVLNFDLSDWLNGEFVKSLFARKYNEEDLQKLKNFYNSELCSSNYDIKVKFIEKLGALKAWVDGNDRAYDGALNEVEKSIAELDSSGSFVKSELSNIKTSLEKLEKELEKKGRNTVRRIFEEELNKDKIEEQLKTKFREAENSLLGSEYLNEKREIVKNSTTEEIKEKIFLKTPSPSRLMRVWNNTKDFFEDMSTYVCEDSHVIERCVLGIGKSLDVDRRAWEVEISAGGKKENGEVVFERKNCITVTPHINAFIEEKKETPLKITVTDKDWERDENAFLAGFREKRTVRGYRTISISPNLFMFLVPASKVFETLLEIKSRYIERFGKVYGKLPLNIGVVYFKRKMPFFVVLDSARRYIDCFKVQKEPIVWEIKEIAGSKISTDIGTIELELPHKLGDGETDNYHPYIMVAGGENTVCMDNVTEKHILSLEKGDKIKIHPSLFDFQFLDTNTRRFDIVLNEGTKKRRHDVVGEKGPRPYLIEDLDKFRRLKRIFKEIGSWTPIRDIEALAASKRQEWEEEDVLDDKEDVYEELIDSALENKIAIFFDDKGNWKKDKKPFLFKCVMDGSFFDAIELFKSIMKMEFRGDEK